MTETNVTPIGRMLSGALFEPSTKGFQGRVLDTPQYFMQLMIPKTDPGLPAMVQYLQGVAQAGFPGGEAQRPDFSWKYKDGDAMGKEHTVGQIVFTFRSQFAPSQIVDANYQQIIDKNAIKPGYQVRCSYSAVANNNIQKPGVFLNLGMVQLVAADTIIQTGPTAKEVFAPLPGIAPIPGVAPGVPATPATPAQGTPPVGPLPSFMDPNALQ